jgi:hypothetical protein
MAKETLTLYKTKPAVKEVILEGQGKINVPTVEIDTEANGKIREFTDKKGGNRVSLTLGQAIPADLHPEILAWLQSGANGAYSLVKA